MSRVARQLNSRNLLQSHSVLGRSRSALIGRQDYILDADGRWRGEVSPVQRSVPVNPPRDDATTPQRSYSSLLSARLEEKADRYYKLGTAYFQERRYPRSRDYFLLVRQLESERPRALVALTLVSLQESNVNTAVASLVHAIERAESLADLQVEWREFYAEEQDFHRVLNSVNVAAKSGSGTVKTMSLLLAFYSFLNDDLNTAIAEAKAAEGQAANVGPAGVGSDLSPGQKRIDPFTAAAKRFGEFLTAARDQGRAPDSSG